MALFKKYSMLVLGSTLFSLGAGIIYLPNKIVTGGVSGASNILYHVFSVPPGLSIWIINFLLVVISLRVLGKTAIIDAVVSAACSSVMVELFSLLPPLTNDLFLATLYGALLDGVGLGICFAAGANTGGTDIIARMIQKANPNLPIGKLLLGIDGLIMLMGLFLYKSIDLCLCGITAHFFATCIIDIVIKKLNVSKLAFVVTDKGKALSERLMEVTERGVTVCDAVGAYTGNEKKLLMCALKNAELVRFQQAVKEVDEEAFVIFSEASQIEGNGFKVYR